jgi:hypothetical protein
MVKFTATIHKFDQQGEKTGWTYIEITEDIAQQLKPNNKKSFRVKGKLDSFAIKGIALMPMGNGQFVMPLNTNVRKGIKKKEGAMLQVQLTVDAEELRPSADFQACLDDEQKALKTFDSLKKSHRNYYINWVEGLKGEEAKAKRLAQAIIALEKGFDFAGLHQMLKAERKT